MISFLKFYATIAVIIVCSIMALTFSCYADDLKTDSSGQSHRPNKKKSKSSIVMNVSIIGVWAGKHITIEVTRQGANVEYDCAHATINKKIILDKKNRFEVSGTQVEEHGGPLRENDTPDNYPVIFIGQIKGKRMTLVVKHKANNKVIDTFILIHGQESLLVKCR